MGVLIAFLGVLAAVAVIVALVRESGGRTPATPAVIGAIAAVVGILAFSNLAYSTVRNQLRERSANAKLSEQTIKGGGGGAFPAREDILSVADSKMPRKAKVYLVCKDPGCAGALSTWITYRLGPRIFTDSPKDADYIFMYNATPADAKLTESDMRDAVRIEDRYAIVRTQ